MIYDANKVYIYIYKRKKEKKGDIWFSSKIILFRILYMKF